MRKWRGRLLLLALGVAGVPLAFGWYLREVNEMVGMEKLFQKLPGVDFGSEFDSHAYLKAAIALQSVGQERACKYLVDLATRDDKDNLTRVPVLCQMLFSPRAGEEFRGPASGLPQYLGDGSFFHAQGARDACRHNIVVIEGVPFRIVVGYELAWTAEKSSSYLAYCMAECEWSSYRYQDVSDEQAENALRILVNSDKWKRPLHDGEKDFLARQIKRH